MSHLHLPDGVVPAWLWLPALPVVFGLLILATRSGSPRQIALQGALGGMMLAAMAIPLGPLEYHLTLAGPVGVLLGAGGSFPVVFVASAILAFVGHGGLTVVGLNTLVLGTAAAVASVSFGALSRRVPAPWAMAFASAAGHAVSALLWLLVVGAALGGGAGGVHGPGAPSRLLGMVAGIAALLWLVGTLVEALVAWGVGRFLQRVHPALLRGPGSGYASMGGGVRAWRAP